MSLMTRIKKLSAARRAYESELEALGDDGEKGVAELIGALLPAGYAFEWTQGTPGFNDGDPCVFSVHDPVLFLEKLQVGDAMDLGYDTSSEGSDEDEDQDDDVDDDDDEISVGEAENEAEWQLNRYDLEHYGKTRGPNAHPAWPRLPKETAEAIFEAWDSLPHDMLEKVFGDDTAVRIRADGEHVTESWSCGY